MKDKMDSLITRAEEYLEKREFKDAGQGGMQSKRKNGWIGLSPMLEHH